MLSQQCRRWVSGALLVLLLPLTAASLAAQGLQTTIIGLVRDPSGGLMPGVTITVTNKATGVVRSTTTDETGSYSVTSLVSGSYDVQAELASFKTTVRQNVPVQNDTATRVDF